MKASEQRSLSEAVQYHLHRHAFALAFGRLLGPRRAYWLIIAGIALYVLLVGADAAVVRAGLMGGLLSPPLPGTASTAYVSLLTTVLILTLINPMALRERQAKLPQTADALYAKIGREALVGMAVNKVLGPFRRSR